MNQRLFGRVTASIAIVLSVSSLFGAAQPPGPASQGAVTHVMVKPADIKWGPAPSLPAGAQLAVLDGNPAKDGPFSVRAKFPDGYMIPPHWHPTDENVVVLQGAISLGMGENVTAATEDYPVGSFARLSPKTPHFLRAKGETIVQIYGPGPFVVNYVNSKDDPRNKKE
jgi:hypothetical protein